MEFISRVKITSTGCKLQILGLVDGREAMFVDFGEELNSSKWWKNIIIALQSLRDKRRILHIGRNVAIYAYPISRTVRIGSSNSIGMIFIIPIPVFITLAQKFVDTLTKRDGANDQKFQS